jgi:hypothetical protein
MLEFFQASGDAQRGRTVQFQRRRAHERILYRRISGDSGPIWHQSTYGSRGTLAFLESRPRVRRLSRSVSGELSRVEMAAAGPVQYISALRLPQSLLRPNQRHNIGSTCMQTMYRTGRDAIEPTEESDNRDPSQEKPQRPAYERSFCGCRYENSQTPVHLASPTFPQPCPKRQLSSHFRLSSLRRASFTCSVLDICIAAIQRWPVVRPRSALIGHFGRCYRHPQSHDDDGFARLQVPPHQFFLANVASRHSAGRGFPCGVACWTEMFFSCVIGVTAVCDDELN